MDDMEALRERVGLTREDVARLLDISETSIRNWETGRTEPTMTPAKYVAILNVYQCSPQELADATQKSSDRPRKLKPGRRKKESP